VEKKRKYSSDEDEGEDEDCISYFPNPTSDFITVRLGESGLLKRVSILRTDGSLLASLETREIEITLTVKDYPLNNYLLQLVTGTSVEVFRFEKR
jgi:hypothetical protein